MCVLAIVQGVGAVWKENESEMQFVLVFDVGMSDPVWVSSCYRFELIERVNM